MEFSVLVTVYKKENPENLRKCLLSSYKQTLKPKEIILVCDGELTEELNEEIDCLRKEYRIYRIKESTRNKCRNSTIFKNAKSV